MISPAGARLLGSAASQIDPVRSRPQVRTSYVRDLQGSVLSSQPSPRPLTPRERRRFTAKLVFLAAGTASFLLSVGLWFLGDDREVAIFVGLWVPSLFALGALVASPERSA